VILLALFYFGNGKFEIHDEQENDIGDTDVKLRVHYCGVCGTDYHIAAGDLDKRIGTFPRVIGHEASGEIVSVGRNVHKWKPGDRVVVRPLKSCGVCEECKSGNENVCRNVKYLGIESEGAFQKYWVVNENIVHKCPETVDYKTAALVEPLAVCAHAIRRSQIKEGQTAVVIGGGPIGIMTALILKTRNIRVLISELDAGRINNCRNVGLDAVNPLETDLAEKVNELTDNQGASVVFEASGSQSGLNTAPELLRPNGRIVTIATYSREMNLDIRKLHYKQIELVTTRAYQKEDYEYVLSIMEQKTLPADRLITKIISLNELKDFLKESIHGNSEIKVLVDCYEG
jgi:2-desacetyl-2-hydroxyethyl bacteriochlorophyllide A dehydrogenase